MKIKYLFIVSLAFMAYGCQDNQDVKPVPTPGEDVQLGGAINRNNLTRTIYGDETIENNQTVFPIYWVKGDRVIVTSPQCDVKQGIYQVPEDADNRDYAQVFTKISNAGVQWGTEERADFYSIYPAEGVRVGINSTSFTMNIPASQESTIEKIGEKTFGVKPSMNACFMYAKTAGVINGSPVDLGYQPLSTAIRFTLNGPDSSTGGSNQEPAIITKILLHAPQGVAIAGDFTVELSGTTPTVTTGNNTSNEVEIISTYKESSGYLTLYPDEKIEVNAFVIPQDGIKITNEWYIEFTLNNGKTYKKSLGAASGTEDSKMTLQAGMIHRLPEMPAFKMDVTWDPANWMVNIPRNVYLSEISIPGSWNSVNTNQQVDRDIASQYSTGIRAFHLDTRWKREWVSEGIFQGHYEYTLGIADGRRGVLGGIGQGNLSPNDAVDFSTALDDIVKLVKDDEYMVLMCTYAQGGYDYYTETRNWITDINDAVTNYTNPDKIADARTITQNTVVGDVLGKVIVIVCCENEIANQTLLPQNSKCMFTRLPLILQESQFTPYSITLFNQDNIYKGDGTTTGIKFNNTQANITSNNATTAIQTNERGYAPTIQQRKDIAGNVLEWSSTNYESQEFNHNAWIYLGLGGYQISNANASDVSGSHKSIGLEFNNWINGIVNNMSARPTGEQTGYYPVGIVLMNFVTNSTECNGPETVNNILQLNTKYRKASDPNWTSGSGTSGTSDVNSAAPGYSSGMTDNNTDAFGWTRSNR